MTNMGQRDNELFKTLLVRVVRDENPNERERCREALIKKLQSRGFTIDDVHIAVGHPLREDQKRYIADLKDERDELRNQVAWLLSRLPPDDLKAYEKAKNVPQRWPVLWAAMVEVYGGEPPYGWRGWLCKVCSTTRNMIKQWESGVTEVPQSALDAVKAQKNAPAVKVKRKGVSKGTKGSAWEYGMYEKAIIFVTQRLDSRQNWNNELAAYLGVSRGVIKGKIYNQGPPPGHPLTTVYPADDDRPMNFGELWKIGWTLFPNGRWTTRLAEFMELDVQHLRRRPIEQVAKLREEYHKAVAKNADPSTPDTLPPAPPPRKQKAGRRSRQPKSEGAAVASF